MASWISLRNRVMSGGDSITVGYSAQTGGWRLGLGAAIEATGATYSTTGPTDGPFGGYHRGVAGQRADAITSAFQTECARYAPQIIIIAWGVNDAANGVTAAAILASLNSIIDWAQAGSPNAKIFVQSVLTIASAAAVIATVNAALPGECATQGVTFVDMGNPVRSDGTHPVDGPTGYDLMVTAMAAAVIPELT